MSRSRLLIFALLLCACGHKPADKYLSQQKMREVIWDLTRTDQYIENYYKKDSADRKARSLQLYADVFRIHKVSEADFVKSYNYYTSRPDIFRPLIDSLNADKPKYVPFFGHPTSPLSRDSVMKLKKRPAPVP